MTARILMTFRLMAVWALSATGLLWHAAQAQMSPQPQTPDAYTQVQQLFRQGQTAQALRQADDYIAANPNDPQMRFVKAAALQVAGRADEAEAILTQLTRDYPELAEPWNNLAVLYAARGQIDAARTALVAALRIDPGYATALENLGDIDIRLALRSYEQARKADANDPRLSGKIEAAQQVIDSTLAPKAPPAAAPQQRPAAAPMPPASPASPAMAPQAEASDVPAATTATATDAPAAAADDADDAATDVTDAPPASATAPQTPASDAATAQP